jgi:hypothetical protein
MKKLILEYSSKKAFLETMAALMDNRTNIVNGIRKNTSAYKFLQELYGDDSINWKPNDKVITKFYDEFSKSGLSKDLFNQLQKCRTREEKARLINNEKADFLNISASYTLCLVGSAITLEKQQLCNFSDVVLCLNIDRIIAGIENLTTVIIVENLEALLYFYHNKFNDDIKTQELLKEKENTLVMLRNLPPTNCDNKQSLKIIYANHLIEGLQQKFPNLRIVANGDPDPSGFDWMFKIKGVTNLLLPNCEMISKELLNLYGKDYSKQHEFKIELFDDKPYRIIATLGKETRKAFTQESIIAHNNKLNLRMYSLD